MTTQDTTPENSFPRQYSRTLRFTLGAPRSFAVSPDGRRVAFLRSAGASERANLLQVVDLPDGSTPFERIAADPAALLGTGEEQLSPEERARRERSREGSAGVVGYATDADVTMAAFALSGRLFTASLLGGGEEGAVELPAHGSVLDPRPSPDGAQIAYATVAGELRAIGADGGGDRALAGPSGAEDGEVTWGQAEFIAQEEMDRSRGFWWSPDSDRLLAARVDSTPVQRWWIADPANPDRPATEIAYPRAGSPNAEVTLVVLSLDGGRTEVVWDREAYPYLAQVHWSAGGPPLLLVQARDQRSQCTLGVDPETGATTVLLREQDPAWLELFPGVPGWTPDGRLVRISDAGGVRALVVGDTRLTGPELQVRAVLDIGSDDVLISASAGEAATDPEIGEVHLYTVGGSGVTRVGAEPGQHSAVRAGAVTVLSSTARTARGPWCGYSATASRCTRSSPAPTPP